jgi:sugar fermentation stimulation protein A
LPFSRGEATKAVTMHFPDPLRRGTLIRRYKRFLADVRFDDGEEITAHVANPGAMTGTADPGMEVWLSPARNPARKLRWSWEMVRIDDGLVGVNTAWPNTIVAEAIESAAIAPLAGYDTLKREVKYGENSRVDIFLTGAGRPDCYVEVKNVHLKRDRGAEFPDAVTKRGTKHLGKLSAMVAAGHRAVMLYLVQREDCDDFRVAADIDPTYAAAFADALANGVETLCYACRLSTEAITLDRALPVVHGSPYD